MQSTECCLIMDDFSGMYILPFHKEVPGQYGSTVEYIFTPNPIHAKLFSVPEANYFIQHAIGKFPELQNRTLKIVKAKLYTE